MAPPVAAETLAPPATAGWSAGGRFDFAGNVAMASRSRFRASPFWPPGTAYRLIDCPLLGAPPDVPIGAALATLREVVEAAWTASVSGGGPVPPRMPNAAETASLLRRIAADLPRAADRHALDLRADALVRGHDPAALADLAAGVADITLVVGNIATWFGKQREGLPTAFLCRADPAAQAMVDTAAGLRGQVETYLRGLHAAARLGPVPAFAAANLLFMAGEGDRHPKHIAYFLPEDEGVKRSPFKKTCYFANSHRALIEGAAIPLARRHLAIGVAAPISAAALAQLPALGVFAHEMGHAVHRGAAGLAALNEADRWMSVTMQELAADVFGTLILAEVFGPVFGIAPGQAIAYHLGECLRYVDRGLGCFPDSDGMFLQLAYLAAFGALAPCDGAPAILRGEPDVLLAGFRSLGRVLADTLLACDVARTVALYRDFGPATMAGPLIPLIAALASGQPISLAYS